MTIKSWPTFVHYWCTLYLPRFIYLRSVNCVPVIPLPLQLLAQNICASYPLRLAVFGILCWPDVESTTTRIMNRARSWSIEKGQKVCCASAWLSSITDFCLKFYYFGKTSPVTASAAVIIPNSELFSTQIALRARLADEARHKFVMICSFT